MGPRLRAAVNNCGIKGLVGITLRLRTSVAIVDQASRQLCHDLHLRESRTVDWGWGAGDADHKNNKKGAGRRTSRHTDLYGRPGIDILASRTVNGGWGTELKLEPETVYLPRSDRQKGRLAKTKWTNKPIYAREKKVLQGLLFRKAQEYMHTKPDVRLSGKEGHGHSFELFKVTRNEIGHRLWLYMLLEKLKNCEKYWMSSLVRVTRAETACPGIWKGKEKRSIRHNSTLAADQEITEDTRIATSGSIPSYNEGHENRRCWIRTTLSSSNKRHQSIVMPLNCDKHVNMTTKESWLSGRLSVPRGPKLATHSWHHQSHPTPDSSWGKIKLRQKNTADAPSSKKEVLGNGFCSFFFFFHPKNFPSSSPKREGNGPSV